jgi:hypothetical protein
MYYKKNEMLITFFCFQTFFSSACFGIFKYPSSLLSSISLLSSQRIASLLCLRAQILILMADVEMSQASNKREASAMSWYGGGQAMEAVMKHEAAALKHEEHAMRDVSWAKM